MTEVSVSKADFEGWLRAREVEIASAIGHTALTGTYELVGSLQLPGAPGVWSAVPGGVSVVASAASGLQIDGTSIDGERTFPVEGSAQTIISAPGVSVKLFRLDGRTILRTYESSAERRGRYEGIERYPYEERWRVRAVFERLVVPETTAVPYQRNGVVRSHDVIGRLVFELEGRSLAVLAFGGHELPWFVFADETTGGSTYRPGRFLDVEGDDEFIIDFNRAYLPPCAFSEHYNCPLPPAENKLAVAVEAGERSVRWRN